MGGSLFSGKRRQKLTPTNPNARDGGSVWMGIYSATVSVFLSSRLSRISVRKYPTRQGKELLTASHD